MSKEENMFDRSLNGFDGLKKPGDMMVMRVDLPDGKQFISGRIITNTDNLLVDIRKVWQEMEEIRNRI